MIGISLLALAANLLTVYLFHRLKSEELHIRANIYNFITGGDSFEEKELLAQLKLNFDDKIYKPTRQEVVYQYLSEPQVLDLSNDEYILLTDEMFVYATKGEYPLDRYLSILFYIERYPEISQKDIAGVAEVLIECVKLHRNKFQ